MLDHLLVSANRVIVSTVFSALPFTFAMALTPVESIPWPKELPATMKPNSVLYEVPKSNYVTDFHGPTANHDLVLFMAGNQYRVLPELVEAFRKWAKQEANYAKVKLDNIFYATTPPGRLIDAMVSGQLSLGNLWFEVAPDKLWPDVFMTGARQQKRLFDLGHVEKYSLYARNRGVVLLVKKGNPRNIQSIKDLARADVRVAISHPKREPVSYESYSAVLNNQGGDKFVEQVLAKPNTISPITVHHRENPQFIADNVADVAPMFYHFGDYLKSKMPELFDYVELPKEGNVIASLGIAKIKSAPRPQAADAWLEFMRTDIAAELYNKHGFTYAGHDERNQLVVPK